MYVCMYVCMYVVQHFTSIVQLGEKEVVVVIHLLQSDDVGIVLGYLVEEKMLSVFPLQMFTFYTTEMSLIRI